MTRKGPSVLFAALLLVAQLLFAAVSGGANAHDGTRHCDGCPDGAASGMVHGGGTPSTDHGAGHCSGCSHHGSTGAGRSGCRMACALPGSGHCGSPATPALAATTFPSTAFVAGSFGSDRRPVRLPDSPLFDLLRPPARA